MFLLDIQALCAFELFLFHPPLAPSFFHYKVLKFYVWFWNLLFMLGKRKLKNYFLMSLLVLSFQSRAK